MANIKLLQLYRNSTIADSLEAAKTLMAEKAQGKDGEILICRYKDSEGASTTLVGVNNVMGGDNNFLTYIESVSMTDVESTVTSEIETALGKLSGGGQGTTGQFVTEVTESNGVITVTYGTITSTDCTVVITGGSGETAGNIDLGVNIDEDTIVLNSDGKLSVSASAGGGYDGADAITIANDKTISLVIADGEQVLSQSSDGLKSTLSVTYTSTDHKVNLCGIGGNVISSFDASEFIVDGMIQSAELVHENDQGETGEFLAITFNTEGGETTTIYIDVSELIDTYTAGDGLALSDHEFSVKVKEGETYLEVTSDGLATKGIDDIATAVADETARAEAAEAELQTAIEAAVAGESTTVVAQGESNTHVTVVSTKEEGSTTTTYTINESDIASATTQSNIISAVGLSGENGTLTDEQKTALGEKDLVTAVTDLIAEVKADETKLVITSSDGSIEVSATDDGTDLSVILIDCGTYD